MKRILGIHLAWCLCGLSVFFTGCNQKTVKTYVEVTVHDETGVQDTTEAETEPLKKGGPRDVDQTLQSEMGQMAESRFDGLNGPRAFYFPENHSQAPSDLKAFKILGLEEDYFYYYYVTVDKDAGKEIHAVARNKKDGSGDAKLLYEREKELALNQASGVVSPFFVHMCSNMDGEYRISIYEEGQLSVIDRDGHVKFSRISDDIRFGSASQSGAENLLELIDQIFGVGGENPSYYDRDVTSVNTDGRYNFYIPVILTVNDYTAIRDDEELETESYLLIYSYLPIGQDQSEYLIQYNVNYQNQIDRWRELGEDEENRGTPQADWDKAVREYPTKWGNYYVAVNTGSSGSRGNALYQWKNQRIKNFVEHKTGATSAGGSQEQSLRTADTELIDIVMKLKGGQMLNGYFFQDDQGGYCPVIGAVKENARMIVKNKIIRTYYVDQEDGDPKEVREEITASFGAKEYFADGSAIERFMAIGSGTGLYMTPGKVVGGDYTAGLCLPGNLCQLVRYPKDSDMGQVLRPVLFHNAGEDMGIYILNSLNGQFYVLGTDLEHDRLLINTPAQRWITLMAPDLNPSGYQETDRDQKLVEGMEERAEQGRTYEMSSVDLYGNPDRFGADNVLILEDGPAIKILITTFYNGMQLYEGHKETETSIAQSSPGTMYRISGYPLYQAWLTGENEVTAVGFDRTDVTYQYMDIARARVYTFHIDEQMKDALSRKIPSDDGGESADPETFPTVPEIPENMQDYWKNTDKRRESKPRSSGSETLPDVFIYETDAAMGASWEEAESRRKEKLESGGEGESEEESEEENRRNE